METIIFEKLNSWKKRDCSRPRLQEEEDKREKTMGSISWQKVNRIYTIVLVLVSRNYLVESHSRVKYKRVKMTQSVNLSKNNPFVNWHLATKNKKVFQKF